MFSERGYDGATFQAIAVRADLTRPAINHYFSSKRVLYREVVEETNELVVAAGIERAQRETTLMGRLSAFIAAAMRREIENPSASAFLITDVLESQRHPGTEPTENDSVRTSREFLTWAVNDAIERGEVAADTDASALTESCWSCSAGSVSMPAYLRSRDDGGRHRTCCGSCWPARWSA